MKTTDYIISVINRLPKGYVFTYADIDSEERSKEAIIKALNRLAASGKISKLAKGKYYKPEQSVFGELPPPQYQVVKDLLEDNGKAIGYLTGYSMFNNLGLTTQVSNTIQIGRNEVRPTFKRGRYTISFVKQKNNITKNNIPLLQLLDSIRYVKKIPDTNLTNAVKRILVIIKELPSQEQQKMVKLAMKYPPSTRALLGAILDEIGAGFSEPLYKSLNQISKYDFPSVNKVLSSTEKWNIV
ncbi:MAG: DUF6088 family protein [Brumimicrobium sp.]